jgi:hypothetical protein
MKSNNEKRKNLIFGFRFLVTIVVVVGLFSIVNSFAFFKQSSYVENFLSTKFYKVDLIDIFDNYQLKLPGDFLNKDVSIKNNGEVEAVVRIQLTPIWTPAIDGLGNVLDVEAVTIGYGYYLNDDWTLIDGWFYYNYILSPGLETSLLVDSLKFNAVSNDQHQTDYSNTIYTLNVLAQSAQVVSNLPVDDWGVVYVIDVNTGKLTWSE